jgi:hypothetical protein
MRKTSVLAVLTAAGLVASPILAQETSSEASSELSQPSSVVSSQLSSEPVTEASSAPSQASSSPGGGGLGFSLDVDASFSFQLTFEQAVEFKRLVIEANSAPVEASSSFDIGVGATVPSTVTLTLLPTTITALYPQLEGFLFFVLPDGRIVVVNPTTLKIVLILAVD